MPSYLSSASRSRRIAAVLVGYDRDADCIMCLKRSVLSATQAAPLKGASGNTELAVVFKFARHEPHSFYRHLLQQNRSEADWGNAPRRTVAVSRLERYRFRLDR
jgi:hypothetical protein